MTVTTIIDAERPSNISIDQMSHDRNIELAHMPREAAATPPPALYERPVSTMMTRTDEVTASTKSTKHSTPLRQISRQSSEMNQREDSDDKNLLAVEEEQELPNYERQVFPRLKNDSSANLKKGATDQ